MKPVGVQHRLYFFQGCVGFTWWNHRVTRTRDALTARNARASIICLPAGARERPLDNYHDTYLILLLCRRRQEVERPQGSVQRFVRHVRLSVSRGKNGQGTALLHDHSSGNSPIVGIEITNGTTFLYIAGRSRKQCKQFNQRYRKSPCEGGKR